MTDTSRGDFDRDLANLGRALRAARTEARISEHELAAASDSTPQDILALEAGKLDPTYDLMLDLTERLNITLPALVLRAEGLSNEG